MQQKIYLNCDGGSRGNPGPAAIGVVLWNENHKKIIGHKECIGETTNNVAEYRSLLKALELAAQYTKNEVIVSMDSELVVRQMKGIYKIKKEHLVELHKKVKEAEKAFKTIIYIHVPRTNSYQKEADRLVNEALDER